MSMPSMPWGSPQRETGTQGSPGTTPFGGGAATPAPPPAADPFGGASVSGSSAGTATFSDPFGTATQVAVESESSAVAFSIARAPKLWLWLALGVSVAGTALAFVVNEPIWFVIAAWLLVGPIAFGLLAWFTRKDNAQRTLPNYDAEPMVSWLFRGILLISLVGLVMTAINFGLWWGRL